MPRANRGGNRRRVASDDEEIEEGSSQPTAQRNTKGRGGRRQVSDDEEEDRRNGGGDEDEDEDEDDEERAQREMIRIIENFTDQPIPKDAFRKLRGLDGEWGTISSKINDSFPMFNNTAMFLETLSAGHKDTERLDAALRELLDAEAEVTAHKSTIHNLEQDIQNDGFRGNLSETYEKNAKKTFNPYRKKTARQKYAADEAYRAFREQIWEANHPGEGMPPSAVAQSIPREEGDESDDSDDDVVVGATTQDYKCPLTLRLLEDPVTSTKCKHSFSKAAIYDLLSGPSHTTACPATGCRHLLTKADLKPNPNLAARVQAYARARRQQAEAEADEAEDLTFDDD